MKIRLQLLVFILGASISILGCVAPQFLIPLLGTGILSRNEVEGIAVATIDARTTPNAIDLLWGTAEPTNEPVPNLENTVRICRISASLEGVIEACSQALALDPNHTLSRMNRGIAYVKLGEYEAGIEDLDLALAILADTEGFYQRATAYMNLSQFEDALLDFDRTLELEPEYINALLARAYTKRNLGDIDAALDDYNQVLRLDADDSQTALALYGVGYLELLRHNFDVALDHFDRALVITPNDIALLSNRAALLVMMGEYDEAIEAIPVIIEQDDYYSVFLNRNLIVAYLLSDRPDKLTEAQAILSDHLDELENWGMLLSSFIFDDEDTQIVEVQSLNIVQIPVELTEDKYYRITARALESGITNEYPAVNPFLILLDENGEIVAYNADGTDRVTLAPDIWESVIAYRPLNGGSYRLIVLDENGIEPNGIVEITISPLGQ